MRTLYFFFLFIALVVLSACDEHSDYVILDVTNGEEYLNGDYYIDERGNEGVVGYMSTRTPELIMIVSLDETILPWGPMDEAVCSVDTLNTNVLTNPSFGLSMLQSMQAIGISRFPAMAWCNQKNGNEQLANASSWRLPTRYELGLIFDNIKSINNIIADVDGTPIRADRYYWTCLEDYETTKGTSGKADAYDCDRANRALPINSSKATPPDKDYWLKKNHYYVRAIKYIYFKNS